MSNDSRWSEVEVLLRAPEPRYLERIRELTRAQIAANRADESSGCGDTLYALCFLLYLIGEPRDVLLVYEAKFLNMDTGSMIDSELLTMHRDRETMMLAVAEISGAPVKLERRVAEAFQNGRRPEEMVAGVRSYFGLDR